MDMLALEATRPRPATAWLPEHLSIPAAILAAQTVVCAICHYCDMSNGESISITLSPAQVDQVVRAAAQGSTPSFSALVSTTLNTRRLEAERDSERPSEGGMSRDMVEEQANGNAGRTGYFPAYEDARLSRSLLRGLSVLTCFGPDNEERGVVELAELLGMSPSTTHRYVTTLVELGLLERSTRSRKYRLPHVPRPEGSSTAGGAGGALLAQPGSDR
jgi:IclR helix-turn-helix domain